MSTKQPWGLVSALMMPNTNGLISFERTIEQTALSMPLSPNNNKHNNKVYESYNTPVTLVK